MEPLGNSELAGRVVIVTGAGRGIGRCHSLELAAHGATVVVNDVGVGLHGDTSTEASPADEVVREIEGGGGTAIVNGASVVDFRAVEQLVAETVEQFGRLDAVVNNAGIVRDRMLTSLSEEDWDNVLAVHLKGTFNLTKHACDHWRSVAKAGGDVSGRIVNTTSGTGLFGNVGQTNYGAAKAAIANFTMITAMEMQRFGVTSNAISPIARTRMTSSLPSMQGHDPGNDAWDPLDPDNSSPVVAWLASEPSGWLTGAILRIDGNVVQRVRPWEVDPDVQYRAERGTPRRGRDRHGPTAGVRRHAPGNGVGDRALRSLPSTDADPAHHGRGISAERPGRAERRAGPRHRHGHGSGWQAEHPGVSFTPTGPLADTRSAGAARGSAHRDLDEMPTARDERRRGGDRRVQACDRISDRVARKARCIPPTGDEARGDADVVSEADPISGAAAPSVRRDAHPRGPALDVRGGIDAELL